MITQQDLERQARILSDKFGLTVVCQGAMAYTDGKKIVLPMLSPVTSQEVLTGIRYFLDHECGHIVGKTDIGIMDGVKQKYGIAGNAIMNAVEDRRVEQVMADLWAGSGINVRAGATHVIDMLQRKADAGDETVNHPLKQLIIAIYLAFRRDLVMPKFVTDRVRQIVEKYKPQLVAIGNVKGTADCVPLAESLMAEYGILKQELNPQPEGSDGQADPNASNNSAIVGDSGGADSTNPDTVPQTTQVNPVGTKGAGEAGDNQEVGNESQGTQGNSQSGTQDAGNNNAGSSGGQSGGSSNDGGSGQPASGQGGDEGTQSEGDSSEAGAASNASEDAAKQVNEANRKQKEQEQANERANEKSETDTNDDASKNTGDEAKEGDNEDDSTEDADDAEDAEDDADAEGDGDAEADDSNEDVGEAAGNDAGDGPDECDASDLHGTAEGSDGDDDKQDSEDNLSADEADDDGAGEDSEASDGDSEQRGGDSGGDRQGRRDVQANDNATPGEAGGGGGNGAGLGAADIDVAQLNEDIPDLTDVANDVAAQITAAVGESAKLNPAGSYVPYRDDLDLVREVDAPERDSLDEKQRKRFDKANKLFTDKLVKAGGPVRQRLLQLLMSEDKVGWRRGLKRGTPDPRTLYKLVTGTSDRVMRRPQLDEAPDTCAMLLVDLSGSMENQAADYAVQAAAVFCQIMDAAHFPSMACGFQSTGHNLNDEIMRDEQGRPLYSPEGGYIVNESKVAAQQAGYRMGRVVLDIAKDFEEPYRHSIPRLIRMAGLASGGTPMGEAMVMAGKRLAVRREKRKVLMVFGDGGPTSAAPGMDAYEYVTHTCKSLEKAGVETVLIGIQTDVMSRMWHKNAVVNNLADLSKTTIKELTKSLHV